VDGLTHVGIMKDPKALPKGMNTLRSDRKKTIMDRQVPIIDLVDEVVEIRPINLDEGKLIDIDELEVELESEIFKVEGEVEEYHMGMFYAAESPKRNPPIRAPFRNMDKARCPSGEYIQLGDTVELIDQRFLEVMTIVENTQTRAVTLRGWELRRTKDLDGELKFKYNEVLYIFEVDVDDSRPLREQSVIEAGLNRVKKVRLLIRTNYPFPAFRFDVDELPPGNQEERQRYVEAQEVLVVRWKYVTTFKSAKDRQRQSQYSANYQSRKLVRLDEKDCDEDRYIPAYALRYQWRGDAVSGRSQEGNESDVGRAYSDMSAVCIDVSDDESSLRPLEKPISIVADTRVSVHVSSNDFVNIDPWTFMGNIRRRFEAQVSLQENNARRAANTFKPLKASAIKANVRRGDTRSGVQTKISKPVSPQCNAKISDAKYSYAEACKDSPDFELELG
jgi:hypothetical protein